MAKSIEQGDNELVALRPNNAYSLYKIGTPVRYNEVLDTAEIFDLDKLNGAKLLDFQKGSSEKIYSSENTFNETESSWALGLGVSTKINLSTCAIEAKYSMVTARASLTSETREKIFMLYKFDNGIVKLNYGAANNDKIVAALKQPVADLYWKIVLESGSFAERIRAYDTFINTYGTGCIVRLDLISYSAAQIVYEHSKSSNKSKDQHQLTFGATFQTATSISSSVNYLKEASEKNASLNFSAYQDTYPVDSTTATWVNDLFKTAVDNIIKKDWANVKAPEKDPSPPAIPEPPKIDPKVSNEAAFDSLHKSFEELENNRKFLQGIKMYNIATKEIKYIADSDKQTKKAQAEEDRKKAIARINDMDKSYLIRLAINLDYIKKNDVSEPYLYVIQKIEGIDLEVALNAVKSNLVSLLNDPAFATNEAMDNFVKTLKGDEIKMVNTYANLLISYSKELDLIVEELTRAKNLFDKTSASSSLLLSVNLPSIPVTEAQFQDLVLLIQMKKDCLNTTTLKDYKQELARIKENFYTLKIIQDILTIENA
ncbi:hypothetical protein [Emticicia sp. 17c]|uniref:hypothetical protein n=1 Tax=Emticicia sp. 17c TaxID=3127704 RepID=UPI00301BABCE